MVHPPLSESLARVLAQERDHDITFNFLIESTERRGVFLFLILFSLPFASPIPIPGLSIIIGFIMLILTARLAMGLPPLLPAFVGEKKIPHEKMNKVLNFSVRFLKILEKWVRPRQTDWLTWPIAHTGNSLLLAFMALVLMLPIPPFIPFSNSLPGLSIILLSASMMEEDGIMIWVAYASYIFTLVYLAVTLSLSAHYFKKYYELLVQSFQ